jgi:hypothetical protein
MIEVPKVAIIVAAGSGTRMGGLVPKQFQDLGGIPLGIHPGLQFRKFDPKIELIYVIAIGTAVLWENLLSTHFPDGGWRLCMGGKSRYESVRNGIKSIKNPETNWTTPVFSKCQIKFNNTSNQFTNNPDYAFLNDANQIIKNGNPDFLDSYSNMLNIGNACDSNGFGDDLNIPFDIIGIQRQVNSGKVDIGAYQHIAFPTN